jgi:hypothetical protein
MTTELVVVQTFLNMFDAETAKSALDAAGIDSMIRGDDCGGMRPHLWMHGVELLVRQEDADAASEILAVESIPEGNQSGIE